MKAESPLKKLIILGVFAGVYIAFAGAGANMAAYSLFSDPNTNGLGRVLSGAVFTGDSPWRVLAGAELFTGNTLISAAVLEKKNEL